MIIAEEEKTGPILAMMNLADIRRTLGRDQKTHEGADILLAAGLPSHNIHPAALQVMKESMPDGTIYSKYDRGVRYKPAVGEKSIVEVAPYSPEELIDLEEGKFQSLSSEERENILMVTDDLAAFKALPAKYAKKSLLLVDTLQEYQDLIAQYPGRVMVMPRTLEALEELEAYDADLAFKALEHANLNEIDLAPFLAHFHHKLTGIRILEKGFKALGGSTPALESVAKVTQKPGSTAIMFKPGYSLMAKSIIEAGGQVRFADLVTELDIDENGMPFQTNGRWGMDLHSVERALDENRRTATLFYLNFPSNPTDYSPTLEEYKGLVRLLLKDIELRKGMGLEPMIIQADDAYSTMMHDKRKFYSIHHTIEALEEEAKKKNPMDREQLDLLQILRQSLIGAHSFSKAFAMAGIRVAYSYSDNPALAEEVNKPNIGMNLTPSIPTLAGLKGAMIAGNVDLKSMEEYGKRLRHLEAGLNDITCHWAVGKTDGDMDQEKTTWLKRLLPVRAKADAGFMIYTDFSFLKGKPVETAIINEAKEQIRMTSQSTQNEFSDNLFEGGTINNSMDAAVWLMVKAGVGVVPDKMAKEGKINLRFSVGDTDIRKIDRALAHMKAAFQSLVPPQYAVRT